MSDKSKLWISVSAILASVILGCVYLGTAYWTDHNTKIVGLIKEGVDPVAAMCALQDDRGTNLTCVILATKKGAK